MEKNILKTLKPFFDEVKKRIINDDFQFIECDHYTANILIDDIKFTFWISNNIKHHFRLYDYGDLIAQIGIDMFKSDAERVKYYNKLKPYIDNYSKTKLKKEKEEQYYTLKKELGL